MSTYAKESKSSKSKTYNIRSMVFPSKKVFYLIDQFERIIAPLFKIKKGPFCDEGLPNKKFRKNEDDYVKVLFELNKIIYKLDKRGPIYIKHRRIWFSSSFSKHNAFVLRTC